jgi:hypothetical protein
MPVSLSEPINPKCFLVDSHTASVCITAYANSREARPELSQFNLKEV